MCAAGAPPEALVPLMRRTIENGFELTGPIARGDWATVESRRGSGFYVATRDVAETAAERTGNLKIRPNSIVTTILGLLVLILVVILFYRSGLRASEDALAAIDECVRNLVCVGADPERIAILDNFCWPSVAETCEREISSRRMGSAPIL